MFYSADYYSFQYQLDDISKPSPKLPSYLELPKGNKTKSASIPRDFLMLAEGSEVEGPIPRLVIPKKGNGDFNLDYFSVCLMSTDMQTQNGLLNFCMKGDAQLLMSQNDQGLFSFVQHFTLHDTMARGFVRPFCLAYLSHDKNKLIHFHDRLSFEFSRVVSQYKTGNLLMFFRDMLHTLSDLQYTREKHLESMETGVPLVYDDDDDPSGIHPVRSAKTEDSSAIENSFPEVSEKPSNERSDNFSEDKSQNDRISKNKASAEDSTDRPEINRSEINRPEINRSEINRLEKTVSDLFVAASKSRRDPKLQLKEFDDAIREVREILSMVSNLLEKHSVEVREFSPNLEEVPRETPLDNKNFNMAQHLEDTSLHLQGNLIEQNWIKWTYAEDSYKPKFRKTLRVKIQKKLRNFEVLTEPTFDSYQLLHSLFRYFDRPHLTLATELDDIKDLDPPEGLLTIGRVVYLNFLANFESCSSDHENDPVGKVESSEDEVKRSPVNVLVKEWMSDKTSIGFQCCSSYGTSNHEIDHLYKSTEVNEQHSVGVDKNAVDDASSKESPPSSLKPRDKVLDRSTPRRPTSLEVSSDCNEEKENCHRRTQPVEKVVSFADHISNFASSKRIGSGILKLFRNYQSQVVDMIYSLLIGRTLIVYTSARTNETEVRDIITALWFFVPGHFSVLPWVTRTLSMQDLIRIRLAGLLKMDETLVPHQCSNSVSFFDLNKKKFIGPSYKSGMLLEVASKRQSYVDEPSFVAYLHSTLFSLANKSFLYFHVFCMDDENTQKNNCHDSSSSWQKRMLEYERATAFFKSTSKVSENDAYIVMNLSKVVKDQIRAKYIAPKEDGTQILLNQIPFQSGKAQ